MKTAAEVIAHAAERHRLQRACGHVRRRSVAGPSGLAKRNRRLLGRGNFGASPNPPRALSNDCANCATPSVNVSAGGTASPGATTEPPDLLGQMRSRGLHLRPLRSPDTHDFAEDVWEIGPSVALIRRKIGPAVERLQLRRQPHAHRPSAGTCRGLHERHVHAIDIGSLFAIDLDGNEVVVQDFGNGGVFERLVRHHVAPVASRVSNREKHRFVALSCGVEGVLPPRVPMDRIICMLEQGRLCSPARRLFMWHGSSRLMSRRILPGRRRELDAPQQDDRGEIDPEKEDDHGRDRAVNAREL